MPDAAVIPFDSGRRKSATRTPRTTRRQAATAPAPTIRGISLAEGWEAWEIALRNRSLAAGTIRSYSDTVDDFAAWLAEQDRPRDVEQIVREDIRLFLTSVREDTSAGNAHKHFRNLRAYFNWLVAEGDRTAPSPVRNDDAPKVTEQEKAPFTEDEVRALMATCKGNTFEDLRDLAIMWVLVDVGPRVQGLADIRHTPDEADTHDVQLGQYRIRIRLKGGDEYYAPIGKKAAEAISRYTRRARARHSRADLPWLWLGKAGRFGPSGVQRMLKRRGEQAEVHDVHPHRFRRTSASLFLDAGGSETGAMHVYGWKSPVMVRHYTKATAKERARREHGQFSPGDRF